MASKKPSGTKRKVTKTSRHYPVQRHIRLGDQTAASASGRFVQASKILSFANRRLYRQSYVYNMKIDVDIDSAVAAQGLEVYVLRDTWDLHGAYKQAMKHYYNAMKEEIANAKGSEGRWHDFRVNADFPADELVPVTYNTQNSTPLFTADTLTDGDHDLSSVTDAAGVAKTFSLDDVPLASQYSIIQEWRERDRVDSDPASVSAFMPYSGLVEDLDDANYQILKDNGRVPPYNDEADLSLWHKVTTLSRVSPDGVMKLSSGFFDAPLGIVILRSAGFDTVVTVDRAITVTFQSGDYKGIKARSYATPILTPEMEYEVV